jgi:RluA family pseudouridine synthase
VSLVIKLSAPATHEFWEIPILFEDDHLLALDKPARLLTSVDQHAPERPSLIQLLHGAIEQGKPWARARGIAYLMNAHRLDFETSGVLLLARSKSALAALADLFGSQKATTAYLALVQGAPAADPFEIEAKIGPQPNAWGLMRVDARHGKQARSRFTVVEKFSGYTLLRCYPLTNRKHQVRVHLRHAGWPIVSDERYGGQPLLLSRLKAHYRLKPGHTERPLTPSAALHAESLSLPHPVTGAPLTITAPMPKDLMVALKYLRRYAPA